ncbi:MAG: PAS domain S-box protein [Gammaproteobacteria bacterium]|nr:PAS domain S-box protein [Gammaproteobacteria bacterium]
MTGRIPGNVYRIGIGLAMLLLAVVADLRLAQDLPFAIALYVIPVILGLWLPMTAAVAMVILTVIGMALTGLVSGDAPIGGMRGVMLLQLLLTSALVLAFRASRVEAERSNLRVSRVLDGANTGFVATDSELRILDANTPWLEMLGSPPHADVIGSRLVEWLPEERRPGVEAVLGFLTPGDRRSFETTFSQQGGQQRFVVVTAYAEKVGDAVRLSAICADVTPIRQAEAKARASEGQLRTHLEHTPLAAVVLDTEQRIRGWNRAAERIFGMPRGRALGRSAWELVPEKARPGRLSPFSDPAAQVASDGSKRVAQLTEDGREVVIQWYHTPLKDISGRGHEVASLGLDVTRQQEVERALRESEAKFSSVFQQSPDSLLLVRRRDRALLEANATLQRMFGWSIDELKARWNEHEQFWVDADHYRRFFRLALENERVEAFESELLRKDESKLAVLCSSSHLVVDGERCHLITIRDLTPIREVEEERYRLLEQLQQAQRLESIGRLAGGVAHDFNNLLAGIQGYTELIDLAREKPAEVGQYAARIMETTQRAADLVGKLLTFSRQGALKKRSMDIHDVIPEMVDLFRQTLDSSIQVNLRLEARHSRLVGDETQLSNALLNLCINARDALSDGGEIEVSTALVDLSLSEAALLDPELEPGSYLLLQVRDDGCGIDPVALEQIFVPFFTTKPKGQGTGLGLPSVYGAVKAHGGTVTVSSEPGVGSCFGLYLPISLAEQSAGAPKPLPILKGLKAAALRHGRVLVVDDEPGVRETLDRNLTRMGYTVVLAADGQEALECFARDPAAIDLVIMDVTMPRMSGDDAFRAMRQLRPDVDVILMSGFGRRAVLQRVLGEGAAGVLKKPFTREELDAELTRVAAVANAG